MVDFVRAYQANNHKVRSMQKITNRREALTRLCNASRGVPNLHIEPVNVVTRPPHATPALQLYLNLAELEVRQ